MKKILFPFHIEDDVYKEAFISAVKFARNMNAELIMLNTFEIEIDNTITPEKYDKLVKNKWILAFNEVSKFNNYYLHNHAKINNELKVRFDHRFIHGNQLQLIKETVTKEQIDLIVLPLSESAEHNKKQFEIIHNDMFDKSTTSVLMIPSGYEFRPISNIVFATDLKDLFFYEFYLNEILKYAKLFDANIHFVHVKANESEQEHIKTKIFNTISQIIEKNKNHCFKSIIGSDVVATLHKYSEENNINLLSVVKEELSFIGELFHKSISDKTIESSKIPVLFMKEKR